MTQVPDSRGYSIVDAAFRLILSGGAYAGKTVEEVVDELVGCIRSIPIMLDHPDDCPGCDDCRDPNPNPEPVH